MAIVLPFALTAKGFNILEDNKSAVDFAFARILAATVVNLITKLGTVPNPEFGL
jgi:hypothetical protein